MSDTENAGYKKIISVLSIIFIGAIGSGLWDVLLKDVVFLIGEKFVDILTAFHSGYVDLLYEGVGEAKNKFLYVPSMVFGGLIIASPFFLYFLLSALFEGMERYLGSKEEAAGKAYIPAEKFFVQHRRIIIISAVFLYSIIAMQFLHQAIIWKSTRTAVAHIERSLEIIRPALARTEYFQLRSEFRQVDTVEKLRFLLNKLNEIADLNGYTLPKVRLYGVEISKGG